MAKKVDQYKEEKQTKNEKKKEKNKSNPPEEAVDLKGQKEEKPNLSENQRKIEETKVADNKSEKKGIEPEGENLHSSFTNYNIWMCPENGGYTGSIERTRPSNLMESSVPQGESVKETWGLVSQGDLIKKIGDFISGHLPTSNEEEKDEKTPELIVQDVEGKDENLNPNLLTGRKLPPSSRNPPSLHLTLPKEMVYLGQKFQMKLDVGFGSFPGLEKTLGYNISVYARSIMGGRKERELISESGVTSRPEEGISSVIDMDAKISELGIYPPSWRFGGNPAWKKTGRNCCS